jgi:hypothetical protein
MNIILIYIYNTVYDENINEFGRVIGKVNLKVLNPPYVIK